MDEIDDSCVDTTIQGLKALKCYHLARLKLLERINQVKALPTVRDRIPLIGLVEAYELIHTTLTEGGVDPNDILGGQDDESSEV